MNNEIHISIIMDTFECEGYIDGLRVVIITGYISHVARTQRSLIHIHTLMVREDMARNIFVLKCLCKLIRRIINHQGVSSDPIIQFDKYTYDWDEQTTRKDLEHTSASEIFQKCSEYFQFDMITIPYQQEQDIFPMSLPNRRHSSPPVVSPPFIDRPTAVRFTPSPQRRDSSPSTVREIVSSPEEQFDLSL